jgi:hypothetical protein
MTLLIDAPWLDNWERESALNGEATFDASGREGPTRTKTLYFERSFFIVHRSFKIDLDHRRTMNEIVEFMLPF